jgi:hypothetical protein
MMSLASKIQKQKIQKSFSFSETVWATKLMTHSIARSIDFEIHSLLILDHDYDRARDSLTIVRVTVMTNENPIYSNSSPSKEGRDD